MIEHLNAHAHIEHPLPPAETVSAACPHPWWAATWHRNLFRKRSEMQWDTHDKNENPVAALNNLHEIFRVILCIGNGNLWIEHAYHRSHKTGNRCRHHFCQGQHGHGSISIPESVRLTAEYPHHPAAAVPDGSGNSRLPETPAPTLFSNGNWISSSAPGAEAAG